ncbi:hypothetical protein HG530_009696 [Fusarium avenaceum]|nr:hypothetical protein HG530_009696 [Fusarium avenaceum]
MPPTRAVQNPCPAIVWGSDYGAVTKRWRRNSNFVEDMSLDVNTLSFAGFAEIKISTVRAAISNTSNGNHAARITLAAPMYTSVSARIILRNTKEKCHDVMPGSLIRREAAGIVPPLVPAINYCFPIAQRLNGINIDILIAGCF